MNRQSTKTTKLSEVEVLECRVAPVGAEGFGECLDLGPVSCPYALPFGYAFLCRHPRLAEIIERTQKAAQAGQRISS